MEWRCVCVYSVIVSATLSGPLVRDSPAYIGIRIHHASYCVSNSTRQRHKDYDFFIAVDMAPNFL